MPIDLCAFYDRAALLASVAHSRPFGGPDFVEVIASTAVPVETFRTKAVAQLLARDGQMAVTATHCFLPFR